ncbi:MULTISPECIES: hypothetical protein [Cellulosimicrobium]|uniref:hypothetical protein n=1 Tax=Cellulosimicrobium TaxID=157920 RepID=UPI000A53D10D|nr:MULTISPECIES: hypothetical protein [Cellulosimicrobium]
MGIGPIYPLLILLYVAVIATVAVLVIWALILTIRLLRSVLAERDARARAGWPPPPSA